MSPFKTMFQNISTFSPKPMQIPETAENIAEYLPTKVLEGSQPKKNERGQFVGTFSYDLKSRGRLKETMSMYIDIPRIPSSYKKGYYYELLKIRREIGDDAVAEEMRQYCNYERTLNPLMGDMINVVILLYTAYPLLEGKYDDLFDSFRRAAIIFRDRDPIDFRKSVHQLLDFMDPKRPNSVVPVEQLDPEIVSCTDDPVFRLDVLYTLRVWNLRPPFSEIVYSKTEMKRVERILMSYDLDKWIDIAPPIPKYLFVYLERKDDKKKSAIDKVMALFKSAL